MSYEHTLQLDGAYIASSESSWRNGLMPARSGEGMPEGTYHRLINGEIRMGHPETRRGTRKIGWMYQESEGSRFVLGSTVQAVSWFRPSLPGAEQPRDIVVVVADNNLWRCMENNPPLLVSAAVTTSTQPCELIAAHNIMLILKGLDEAPQIYDPFGFVFKPAGLHDLPAAASGRRQLPAATTGTYASGRIWLKTGYDNIIASDIFEFDYQVANTYKIESGGNGEIVRLWPYAADSLLIFKTDGVFKMTDIADLSAPVVERVYAAKGCVAARSIAQIGSNIFYLSDSDIEMLQVTGDGLIVQSGPTVSRPVHELVRAIDWSNVSNAQGMAVDGYYMLNVPSVATWDAVDTIGSYYDVTTTIPNDLGESFTAAGLQFKFPISFPAGFGS